jgi:ParB-like chromosome segregation protein Spo0J
LKKMSFKESHAVDAMRPSPADRIERWPLERLVPYANNPRSHSEADLDKIAASILKWGWTMPVLADEEGGLISRHARIGAAAKLGLTSIPVIVARGWSEEEKRAYRIADKSVGGARELGSGAARQRAARIAIYRVRSRPDRI